MKVIVDDKIPYIKGQIEQLVDEVLYLSGAKIAADDVRDADILIIRTRTICNQKLLEGSRVRLIVTATIGFDHLDTKYLEQVGIEWHNCPGCNATSVAQYVRNSLYLLQREKGVSLKDSTLGIIGVGNVGTQVLKACQPLVKKVLLNDPPREERERVLLNDPPREEREKGLLSDSSRDEREKGLPGNEADVQPIAVRLSFCSLEQLKEQCDIITIHTPLVRDGRWPSLHLVNEAFLEGLRRNPVLINCGRGEVVDNEALVKALDEGWVSEAIIDTWEREPQISRALLNKVYIGTPHIAGYSADGKANGTRMSLRHVAQWLERQGDSTAMVRCDALEVKAPSVIGTFQPSDDAVTLALQLYDPRQDSHRLKNQPDGFEKQRGDYPLRREFFD